ncbi:MAG: hypothetical protein D5S00_11065 [Tindallia sp. MSAO_Bac2]|nr:MAG: hypothetical protein D5S00_11065 [Tindallia sp. MSAO_Bac2]
MIKHRQEGYISIVCLIIGMSVIALTLSVMTLYMNDFHIQRSSANRIRAQYLAESGMDMTMHQLNLWAEEAIEDLLSMTEDEKPFPFQSNAFLEENIINRLYIINQYEHTAMSQLYPEYKQDHGIYVSVKPSANRKTLKIRVQGYYANARIYLEGIVLMPRIETDIAEDGTENVRIRNLYLQSLLQGYPEV